MEAKITVEQIDLDDIQADPQNVNRMSDRHYRALREDIKQRGYVQPVIVRKLPDERHEPDEPSYQIIDGEHRWRALGELGVKSVPCVIQTADDIDAQVQSLVTNLHGSFVPIRMANMLANLTQRMTEAEIEERLALDRGQLESYMDLAGYLTPEEPQEKPQTRRERPPGVEIAVVASKSQSRAIENALRALTNDDPDKNGGVVARKAREYLKTS